MKAPCLPGRWIGTGSADTFNRKMFQRNFTMANELHINAAAELIRTNLARFGRDRLVLATSFSIEDQVLTHLLIGIEPGARIFTLDTGRQFQETYNVQMETQEKYGIRFEVLVPESDPLADFISANGPNAFYGSIPLRKQCCEIRKLQPLRKVLNTADAWICGLRQAQSITRTAVKPFERDEAFQIYKINPLWNWSEEQVWDYVDAHKIPYNPLQKKGFPSIGCAPCTRAVRPGDDIRSGRWWWESPEHKECGLHRPGTQTTAASEVK